MLERLADREAAPVRVRRERRCDWLVGWLSWLVGWLVVDWLVGWLSVGWLVGWLGGWLAGWLGGGWLLLVVGRLVWL